MDKVSDKLDRANLGRIVMDGLLREVVRARLEAYSRLEAEEIQAHKPTTLGSSSDMLTSADVLSTQQINAVSICFGTYCH